MSAPIWISRRRKESQIVLRIGLSPTSIEEAKKNLAAEIPGWDFDAVRAAAKNVWNENLSRIEIESRQFHLPPDVLFGHVSHHDGADVIQ